jgi:hypothetical protein
MPEGDPIALQQHLSLRRLYHPRDDLDEGALSGAVFSEDRVDAPPVARERDAVEGHHSPVVLGNVAELKKGGRGSRGVHVR